MIIEIERIEDNKIIIRVDGKEKYLASKSWNNLRLDSENYLITTDDKLLYYTESPKLHHYVFLDDKHNLKGSIDKKTIEFEDHKYTCYEKATGIIDNVCIYDKDKQIAQVVIPQNYGKFYIFILPECESIEVIISLYSILCDSFSLWDTVDERISYPVGFKYTYSKDDKYYNKDWLINNFDKNKVDNIYKEINIYRQNTKTNYLNYSKKLLLVIGLSWLVILLIIVMVFILK